MTSGSGSSCHVIYKMADEDSTAAIFSIYIVLPIFTTFIILKFYGRELFNCILAYILSRQSITYNEKMVSYKKRLFQNLLQMKKDIKQLTVIEIGAGPGANFEYYPSDTNLLCLEPNDFFRSYLTENHSQFDRVNLKAFIVGYAEDMSAVPDNSVDAVVSTLVLCSVNDVNQCLSEVRRVLKPGGKFLFLEHVVATESSFLHFVQEALMMCFFKTFTGCSLTRRLWENIEMAGFSDVAIDKFYAPVDYPARPHIMGSAIK